MCLSLKQLTSMYYFSSLVHLLFILVCQLPFSQCLNLLLLSTIPRVEQISDYKITNSNSKIFSWIRPNYYELQTLRVEDLKTFTILDAQIESQNTNCVSPWIQVVNYQFDQIIVSADTTNYNTMQQVSNLIDGCGLKYTLRITIAQQQTNQEWVNQQTHSFNISIAQAPYWIDQVHNLYNTNNIDSLQWRLKFNSLTNFNDKWRIKTPFSLSDITTKFDIVKNTTSNTITIKFKQTTNITSLPHLEPLILVANNSNYNQPLYLTHQLALHRWIQRTETESRLQNRNGIKEEPFNGRTEKGYLRMNLNAGYHKNEYKLVGFDTNHLKLEIVSVCYGDNINTSSNIPYGISNNASIKTLFETCDENHFIPVDQFESTMGISSPFQGVSFYNSNKKDMTNILQGFVKLPQYSNNKPAGNYDWKQIHDLLKQGNNLKGIFKIRVSKSDGIESISIHVGVPFEIEYRDIVYIGFAGKKSFKTPIVLSNVEAYGMSTQYAQTNQLVLREIQSMPHLQIYCSFTCPTPFDTEYSWRFGV